MSHIGTLNERTLHRQLKQHVAKPDDEMEVELEGFVADIVRGGSLVEIQTASLGAMGRKLDALLDRYDVTVVMPIALQSWLHRPDRPPRKSPVKRSLYNVFDELVSMPTLIDHPRFQIRVVLIEEDTHRVYDQSLRRRRGGWRTVDRSIRSVVGEAMLTSGQDLAALVPNPLPDPFTTADLAKSVGIKRDVAQRMAYCLRAIGVFEPGPRRKAGIEYRLVESPTSLSR